MAVALVWLKLPLNWANKAEREKRKRAMMATGKLGITVPFGQVTCCNRTEKKVLQPMNTQARHPNSHSCTTPPYQERGRKEEEKLMDQGKDRRLVTVTDYCCKKNRLSLKKIKLNYCQWKTKRLSFQLARKRVSAGAALHCTLQLLLRAWSSMGSPMCCSLLQGLSTCFGVMVTHVAAWIFTPMWPFVG